MRNASRSADDEITGVLAFVGSVWAVFLISLAFPAIKNFGLIPRDTRRLVGILTMPFLHEGWTHIIANTLPLIVLLALLSGSRARSWEIVIDIILLSGGLLWIFGRTAVHIGASALIFGLASFLIVSGLLERRIVPLLIALIVGFFYGGSLVAGVLPRLGTHVSWEGHLCGAIAGGIVAVLLTRESRGKQELDSREITL